MDTHMDTQTDKIMNNLRDFLVTHTDGQGRVSSGWDPETGCEVLRDVWDLKTPGGK